MCCPTDDSVFSEGTMVTSDQLPKSTSEFSPHTVLTVHVDSTTVLTVHVGSEVIMYVHTMLVEYSM